MTTWEDIYPHASDGSLRLYDLDAALAHKRRVAQAKQSMGLIPDAVVNEASVLPAHSMYFKTSPGISKQKIITDPLKKAGFVGSPKKEHNPRESQPDYMPELRAVSCLNQGEQIPSEVQQRMRSVKISMLRCSWEVRGTPRTIPSRDFKCAH